MAYFLEVSKGPELDSVGRAILDAISQLKFNERNFKIKYRLPLRINQKEGYELWILGTFFYSTPHLPCIDGFDRVFAIDVRSPDKTFSPDILEVLQAQGFLPNWAIMLGIESANGFDYGPFHKNLSETRLEEALGIGRKIKQCDGIERVLFAHSSVDNREVIRNPIII